MDDHVEIVRGHRSVPFVLRYLLQGSVRRQIVPGDILGGHSLVAGTVELVYHGIQRWDRSPKAYPQGIDLHLRCPGLDINKVAGAVVINRNDRFVILLNLHAGRALLQTDPLKDRRAGLAAHRKSVKAGPFQRRTVGYGNHLRIPDAPPVQGTHLPVRTVQLLLIIDNLILHLSRLIFHRQRQKAGSRGRTRKCLLYL